MTDVATRSGILLMIAAMACFSLSDVVAKRLMNVGMPVLEILWFRYAVLGAVIVAMLARRRSPLRSTRPWLQAARGLCILVSGALFNAGIAALPLATATASAFSSPLFVTLLSWWLLRERVDARQWVWVVLGFIGVLIVTDPDPSGVGWAVLLPIASAAVWACAVILTRRVVSNDPSLATLAWSCAVGMLVLTSLQPLVFRVPSPAQFAQLVLLGAFWAGAQWLTLLAYTRSEAARVAPFAYSQLLWANVLSVAILADVPPTTTIVGSLVILTAGFCAARFNQAPARPPRTDTTV